MTITETLTKHAYRLYHWDKNSEWNTAIADMEAGEYTKAEVINCMIFTYSDHLENIVNDKKLTDNIKRWIAELREYNRTNKL
jgi:hypothetical protein